MKYIITLSNFAGYDEILAETDSQSLAFKFARTAWDALSDANKDAAQVSVIESADSDPYSDDHTSGSILGFLSRNAYLSMMDKGMETFCYEGDWYATIEEPHLCEEYDHHDGCNVKWLEALAIRRDDWYTQDDGQFLYNVHWDLDEDTADYDEPSDVFVLMADDGSFDAREYSV